MQSKLEKVKSEAWDRMIDSIEYGQKNIENIFDRMSFVLDTIQQECLKIKKVKDEKIRHNRKNG